eukprot:796619-Amphidinium_carterae.1
MLHRGPLQRQDGQARADLLGAVHGMTRPMELESGVSNAVEFLIRSDFNPNLKLTLGPCLHWLLLLLVPREKLRTLSFV